jgi:hypothetical protein
MTNNLTPTTPTDDVISKQEALDLERQGKAYLREFAANSYGFFIVLHKLQAGDAHILRGFSNFGEYAADKFDDVSAENAKKMAKTGATLSRLQEQKRLGKVADAPKIIGTRAVRALSAIDTKKGTAFMLAVFDLARENAKDAGKPIHADMIEAARLELEPPKVMKALPEPEEPEEDVADGSLIEHGELTSQLLDHIGHAQEALGDLFDEVDSLENGKARISIAKAVELVNDLPQALDLALAEQAGDIIDSDAAA